jgi:hypothetical protein
VISLDLFVCFSLTALLSCSSCLSMSLYIVVYIARRALQTVWVTNPSDVMPCQSLEQCLTRVTLELCEPASRRSTTPDTYPGLAQAARCSLDSANLASRAFIEYKPCSTCGMYVQGGAAASGLNAI